MAPAGTLWTIPSQVTGKIIRATAALAGVEIALPESYEHFVDNKKPEFLAKFSHGKIPAWEGADGFKLFEGAAIARYIASLGSNANLLGLTPEDAGLVDQWSHLAESELDYHTSLISYITSGTLPYTKPTHNFSLERQARTLDTLETYLKTRTFFVGERITLADITVAGFVFRGVSRTIDAPARAKYPNLIRHLETIVNQPKLKEIFGAIDYIEKGLEYKPPAKEKKEPKPAAAPTPKAEKKPKKEEPEDDDEPAVPAEPKVKNPLDDLPKSTFNLEDWKRAYSNKETRGAGGAIEWFYENYDPEGFSIWRIDFKYNEELTQTFMSNNQIGGFFNRLEASRKYLFGSVGVLGTSGNSVIAGVFVTRGPEIQATVDAAPDWESYAYKKLDVKGNEEDKKFFEAALAWDLELDGKAWTDGKNFK